MVPYLPEAGHKKREETQNKRLFVKIRRQVTESRFYGVFYFRKFQAWSSFNDDGVMFKGLRRNDAWSYSIKKIKSGNIVQ